MPNPLYRLPPFENRRIGLFGGSFNPSHEGHLALSLTALKRLHLDAVWWMISPQNPLKDPNDTDDFQTRLAHARQLVRHPRIEICDFEAGLNTRITAETLDKLRPVIRRGRFVWLMGADSFAQLHKWHRWRAIPGYIPLAVFDRPGFSLRALQSPAAHLLAHSRIASGQAAALVDHAPPAWAFLSMPLRKESSSSIRRLRD